MPLLGKLVVIKRSGGDGTEFPLTASCLFGRKPDCDIRIQLPQVSKEHCRIELNENKELILTNLSSVNPTRINGQVLQQSERLKHGDLITVIDRSFRFEYPPAPTPKKKAPSTAGKGESLQKVLQDQQARDTSASAPPERRKSKQASDNCLKDGSNLPATVESTVETTQNDKEDKPSTHALSPFCELYQMVKQDLDTKSPWKPTKGQPMTPLLRPGSQSPGKQEQKCLTSEVRGISDTVPDGKSTADGPAVAATPKSAQKKRRSSKVKAEERSVIVPLQDEQCVKDAEKPATSQETPGKQSGPSALPQSPARSKGSLGQKSKTPEKFSPEEVVQQILSEPQKCERVPKSPKRRRSEPSLAQSPGTTSSSHTAPENVAAPVSPMVLTPEAPLPTVDIKLDAVVKQSPRTSPRANAGKRFQVQDVLNEVVSAALPETRKSSKKRTSGGQDSDISAPKPKRKRVSFGGQLSPEFFDKRLPPNSPLQRGATPGRRSLGLSVKPQSLLRRASTIGLTRGLKLKETVLESPKAKGSPASKASPKRSSSPAKKANTPSPARKSPDTKGKAPSPKTPKSPVGVAKTPSPARKRASSEASQSPKGKGTKTPPAAKTPSPRRGEETPTVKGRFSISRIGTPSPVADQNEECAAPGSQAECATPKVPLRRQSMKASARKTPGSVMKSALEVMRSRRSGASRANLKVVRSFADVVRFGQTKPQINIANRKPAIRRKITKKSKATTPKTPAQKLRDHFSTGHAASPPTIVIGRSQLRVAQPTGAAPRLVPNFALLKKDMKMDEDFTGVADIFKTPVANKTRKALSSVGDCVETPCGPSGSEMSVISTPEGSGEMTVSPLSVASAVKHYNSEAVSRLLENDQEASFVVDDFTPASDLPVSDTPACEVPSDKPTEEQAAALEMGTKTPKNKPAVASCLTGVKRLMKTPKEKAEPIEDLRGRLLKTPKEQRTQQEENLVGVKELLKTPKHRGVSVKNSPVLCAAGMRRLMKTPKEKRDEVEDVTDLRRLMKTPKVKGVSVEDDLGIERLMKTPRQKKEPVEADLSGAEQQDASTKTPRQKVEPAEDQMCLNRLMTPKNKDEPAEDLPGLQQLMQTPMEKGEPVEEMSTTPEEKNSEVLDAFVEQQELAEELSCSPPEMDKETSNELARSSEASSAAPAHDEAPEGEVNEEMPKHENMEIQSPVEDVVIESAKSDSQCFAAEQMEDIHEPECDTAHESIPQVDEIVGDTHVEQIDTAICDSEEISAALDSSKGMPSVEPEEEPPVSPPVKKTPRGRRPKNVNEQENEVVVKTNVRSRRLNKGNQLLDSLPAPSPVRKSARGRIEKRIEDAPVSKHSVGIQEQGPTSQLAVVKTSRGRKAKQNPVKETTEPFGEVEVAEDTQENADPCVEVAEKSDSPDPSHKSRRGRKIVKRATNTPVMDSDIAETTKEKDTELLTSAETEVPTAVPLKPRRGKKSKQEMEKEDERGETVLSDTQNTVSASLAEELPQEGEVRAGRGRRARQGVGKAEPQATNEPKLSVMVKEQEVSASSQKTTSGRGRKAKQPKLQMSEVIDGTQQAVDTSANVTEAREQPEAVVRTGRGGRRMAKPNAQALAQKELEAVTQARPVRGKRAAGVNKDKDKHDSLSDEDGSNVTEATEMEPIVNAARPTRNRKTAVNREPQIVEEAPAEPVASHKKNRGRAKMVDTNIEEEAAPQPCTDETLSTSTEVLGSGVLNKGKGRPSRKRAVVEKSTDIGEAPEGVSDDGQNKGQLLKKSLSWNPNLTSAKDTEEPEPQAKEQLPQKRSRRGFSGTEVNSEGAAESHSQSKPQRGRGAKKLVEPSAAETLSLDADQAKDTKAQPVRRGRTRTTKPLESEPIEDPPSPPKKAAKRKGRGEVSQDVEPENQAMKARDAEAQIDVPPPSKGRRGASKKVETPSDLEVEKKEATIQKETSKVSRGRRKNTQETDAAQTEEEGQVSGGTGGADVTKTNSRGGRRAGSKAQPVTCVETAPAKRTRRK